MHLFGDNGIISNAQNASVTTRFALYDEELGMNVLDDTGIYASGENLKNYIPDIQEQDIDKFVIIKSKLLYIGSNDTEVQIAEKLGLGSGSSDSSDSGAAIQEIQTIISGAIKLGDTYPVPTDDSQGLDTPNHIDSSEGLVGTRLFDRNSLNLANKTWNILIEYDRNNNEIRRYGSGYYWLKKGETYVINGETLEFKNDYVVDYAKNEYTILSGRAVNWNEDATLAVGGAILNLDPLTFSDGEWRQNTTDTNFYDFYVKNPITEEWTNTGVQKTGEVSYNSESKSLVFNTNNTNGYLKLKKSGVDFTNGFTFEIFGNLDTLNDGKVGIFSRRPSINSDFTRAMRFHIITNDGIGRFGPYSEISNDNAKGKTGKIYTRADGFIHADADFYGIKAKEDFYMTVIFRSPSDSEADEYMKTNDCYKYEYYLNGKLLDYTYYGKNGFQEGLKTWNNDECPFFIGVCCWARNENNFYYKGKIFATRLYQTNFSSSQVKENYDMTLKYRSSF